MVVGSLLHIQALELVAIQVRRLGQRRRPENTAGAGSALAHIALLQGLQSLGQVGQLPILVVAQHILVAEVTGHEERRSEKTI